ncbi:metal ABC transporter substrate-binding protein [Priestia taiwanensis]|uniref:Adhesin n=1 Tax=Priestia taiwanensis TaxID=1347902 RepID=A0A917AV85_9BACI|nr:metal ABC transporter substrate-binding protein [Priestia taiwanensis]MBM7363544.1 zinc transport system substrate-binding protein [Priestia taiwanensis]GGE76258.1 adhesin [Priestia taiwanensis]
MNKKIIGMFALLFVMATFFTACSDTEKTSGNTDKVTVYTTIFPLEDLTNKIGGDFVEVKSVYPPGADSHTYEPTQKTMVDIAKSDLFIYNGAGMEGFADKVTDILKNEDTKVIVASDGVDLLKSSDHHHGHEHGEEGHDHNHGKEEEKEEHNHDHGDVDPHLWFDPVAMQKVAENIKNGLVAAMPSQEETFNKNYEDVLAKLQKLDADYKAMVDSAAHKEILVSHAAYGYYEKRYGIKQIPITGISASQEPSQKQLTEIVQLAKEHQLDTILFETLATPKVAEVVKKEIGADSLTLNHIATILEEDKKNNKDYFSLMYENLEILKKAMN